MWMMEPYNQIISMVIVAYNLRLVHGFRMIVPSLHTSRFPCNSLSASSLRSDVDAAAEKIDWQMHRDECDDWLDEVLIQRSNKEVEAEGEDTTSSIFSIASLVVEHFISRTSSLCNMPPLRRVQYEDITSDSGEQQNSHEQMFAPLFDTHIKDIDTPTTTSYDNNPSTIEWTPKKKRRRTNLKLTLAYRGRDFCGWEDQRHELYRNAKNEGGNASIRIDCGGAAEGHSLPSVQGTLVDILDPDLGNRANDIMPHQRSKRKTSNKPIEIKVAGRTDRGVGAIGQVCRIRTWKEIDGIETYIQDLVNDDATTNHDVGLCVTNVERVGNDFHPSFGASSRSYLYLIDLENEDDDKCNSSDPRRISPELVPRLNEMLRALEGKELDYFALSHGKVKTQTTLCTLYLARAGIVEWTGNSDDDGAPSSRTRIRRAICFELVGNRFLRRMVRILVATALREAYRDDDEDALLRILASRDRRVRSRAAPPDGLIFIGASF